MSTNKLPPLKGDGNGVYRVRIVGNSVAFPFLTGTGKSTLGDELSEILGVPCIHLDRLYFKPGWVVSDREDFRERLRKFLKENEKGWVADGLYPRSVGDALDSETDVIWLDPPFMLYFPRIFKRTMGRLFGYEPPCAPGCTETFRSVFFDSDSILWWAITNHFAAKRRHSARLITDGIDIGGKVRRIGGWGGELRRWMEDVRNMVEKAGQ